MPDIAGAIIIAVWIAQSQATAILRRNKYITKLRHYLVDGVIELLLGVFFLLYLEDLVAGVILLSISAFDLYLAWKHRNDDDDNEKGKKAWASVKSRIPKPKILAIRPVQQGT